MPALSRQEYKGNIDPHRVDWMDHLLGSTSSRRRSRGFFLQLKQITPYRFRKLIHGSTIANWHVFFSGLALAR